MDSDDDLDLPPPRKVIDLDSDDDLPPPAALARNGTPKFAAAAAVSASPNKGIAPRMPVSSPNTAASPVKSGKAADDGQQAKFNSPTDSKGRPNPTKVYKEGFLFKQQPSWPYSHQKRYCVIKNCKLFYFDSQESMKEGRPQGVIDLNNAKLVDPGNDAKLPSSFGIDAKVEKGSEGGNKKQRTFIFSVMHAHELGEWRAAVQAVVGDTEADDEVHWFEKMLKGTY